MSHCYRWKDIEQKTYHGKRFSPPLNSLVKFDFEWFYHLCLFYGTEVSNTFPHTIGISQKPRGLNMTQCQIL